MNPGRGGRLKLLVLVVLFVAPLAVAALLYFVVPEWRPSGRVNYGRLIEPVRASPALALVDERGAPAPLVLRGKWSLVYLAAAHCDDACVQRLVLTRQVRLALNQNRGRVQRIYLAPDAAALTAARGALAAEHPDMVWLAASGAAATSARAFFAPADPHAVYLLDPLGNWVMAYEGELQPKGLHKDLKKLLRFSQNG